MYIVHTVKKDEYMEQYTQMIGKNVYTVRGKVRYLVVRRKLIISFLFHACLEELVSCIKSMLSAVILKKNTCH